MTMTWDDVVELLAFAAVYDQRKADELDVKAWLLTATTERWTSPVAQRVVGEHYARGADRPRITPAAISDRLRTLRGRAAESFEAPRIPDDLGGLDYPTWLRARLTEHIDRALGEWADTGVEPGPRVLSPVRIGTHDQLAGAAPTALRAEIRRGLRAIGRGPGPNAVPTRIPRARHSDPARRAAAQAELNTVEVIPVPDVEAAS